MNVLGQNQLSEEDGARKTLAHVLPIVTFLGLMALVPLLEILGFVVENDEMFPWYRHAPEQWLYPVQVIVCLCLIKKYWKRYDFVPLRGMIFATLMGAVGILVWIMPGYLFSEMNMEEGWWKFFGFTVREGGFDPAQLVSADTFMYWLLVVLRFVRMVVVVAIIEEVFWRGFLMRYFLDKDGNYWQQPFGKFSLKTYVLITILFMVVHSPADYFGAFIYGSIAYWVAVRTKSLAACVLMHSVANFLLGCYVMSTGEYGYW
jgi:hypothetical protein